MYESASGGKVTKSYAGTPKEEAQNLAAAKVLADKKGWHVDLLANPHNKKSADAKINGRMWEIKTNGTATANAIDVAIKGAKGQARNVVLHIQSDIDIGLAVSVATKRLKRSAQFDEIIVIAKNGDLYELVKTDL